ncbi:pseudomonapepsin [Sulfolobales archaeon HS-7]|nr:pseudomonapepsin [Sulfolobales archaeon HS-7]
MKSKLVILTLLALLIFGNPLLFLISNSQATSYLGPNLTGIQIRPLQDNATICFSVYFTPSQTLMFGKVLSFLESRGLKPVYLSKDNLSIMVEGTASQINSLFRTKLYLYETPEEIYYKPYTYPEIPSQLRGFLIGGLTNYTTIRPQYIVLGQLKGNQLVQSPVPNSINLNEIRALGIQFSYTYYTPKEIQGAYNVTPLLTDGGKGVTVAVIDAYGDPTIYQDLKKFDSLYGLPPVNLTVIPVGPYHPTQGILTGWSVETALDVEAIHSMAPYAHIDLIAASSPANPLYEAIDLVVSEHLADVVSMSWGAPENVFGESGFYIFFDGQEFLNYPYVNYYFALGSSEGITFFAASGDEGAYEGTTTSYGGVVFPASSPFVTGVGGTTLMANVTSGYVSIGNAITTYGYETAWSISPQYSGETVSSGGGMSTLSPSPWYQYPVTHSSQREVPDVAADANPYTGFVIVADGQKEIIGGTSVATPLWAGITTDIISYIGKPIGMLNPYLYKIYQNPSLYNETFHRIYLGSNGVYQANGKYNMVTGLGSPNAGMLAQVLKSMVLSSIQVQVTTYSPFNSFPQYLYNNTFEIIANAYYPNGSNVVSGTVDASISTMNGIIATVPLTFNGTEWIGTYTIPQNAPLNSWIIGVNVSSGGFTGTGATYVDVGLSGAILLPVPYPNAAPIPPNTQFGVAVTASYPNGTPVLQGNFTAYFVKNGKTVFTVPLIPIKIDNTIVYEGEYGILPGVPQGNYIMIINGSGLSVYEYVYVGMEVYSSSIFTQVNGALPSAYPGSNVTFVSFTTDASGEGYQTSNMTVYLYKGSNLVATIPMSQANNLPDYGIFFGYIANYTIPQNFTPGFYTVVFHSFYNSSIGTQYGNYTTQLYISPAPPKVDVLVKAKAYEGQWVYVYAKVNGLQNQTGVLTATIIPESYSFDSEFFGAELGVPLQYNSSLGEWIGVYRLPSIYNESIYEGLPPSYLSGPWEVIVAGSGSNGANIVGNTSFYVEPYTDVGKVTITPTNESMPFVAGNMISGIYSPEMIIQDMNSTTLTGDTVTQLVIENSNVTISTSSIVQIYAVNSNITITSSSLGGSKVALTLVNSDAYLSQDVISSSEYAFNQSSSMVYMKAVSVDTKTLSLIPAPTFTVLTPNITTQNEVNISVSGQQLKVINVTIDDVPVTYKLTPTSSGYVITIPFNSSSTPDGAYVIHVDVSDGLSYIGNLTFYNSYHDFVISNAVHSLTTSLSSLSGKVNVSEYLSIVALVIAIIAVILIFVRGGKK